jgi:hypothetical protein
MCQSTISSTAGASDNPVIYSMPESMVPTWRAQLGDGTNAASVSFTDNGSLYLSTINQSPGTKRDAAVGEVGLFGASVVDGALTAVTVDDVTMSDAGSGTSGEQTLSMVFRMVEPRKAAVRFVFDVNANSVALRSATPVDEAGEPVTDADALGLDLSTVWCVTKNGGAAILPALIKALPSLIGGPAAFMTAVLAALPGAAITTVQSVIANCFS